MSKRYNVSQTYKLKSGPYDSERPEFDHVNPCYPDNGQLTIVDCWVCTSHGKIHPGYNVAPVPILVEEFVP